MEISGGKALEKYLKKIADQVSNPGTLRVGFLENATYPDGTPVATVAAIENFGAPAAGIPARPFFTHMVKKNSPEWGAKLAKLLEMHDWDATKALEMMGGLIAGQLREVIISGEFKPNSPVTNLLKQRFPEGLGVTFADVQKAREDVAAGVTAPAGKPLSWSGNMLNSVDSEVEQ